MKLGKTLLLVVTAAALTSAVAVTLAHRRYNVSIEMSNDGLKSLSCRGVDYLSNGSFFIHQAILKNPAGETRKGAIVGETHVDIRRQQIKQKYPWGEVGIEYATHGNRLELKIHTTNTSDTDTIESLWYQPLTLILPAKATEYDGSIPMLAHNIGDVGVVKVSFGSAAVAIVSEDIAKPLMVGFPWADNRPINTVFPLSVHTGRVNSFPDSFPPLNRPIPPKGSDEYRVSLRFGPADEPVTSFAPDLYKKFSDVYPSELNWKDRRPIGAIFLASADQNWTTNPRGWLNDSRINVFTPEGRADFKQRILGLADGAIAIMKDMHAQGAITWDIEGQEFRQANYVGDPRAFDRLAPEMASVADAYFARFRDAGLRAGICVRPQELKIAPDGKSASQTIVTDPAQLLMDKIAYARKRWGISLVYVDSNTNLTDSNPLDADIFKRLAKAFPDCLLIPEHANLRYYAYSAPYKELRQGFFGTPALARETYPSAFTIVYTADGPLDYYRKGLASSVKQGDSMMYRTWWRDPQNEKVKTFTP